MPLQVLSDIVAIKGKVATDIRDNRPTLTSSLIVLVAGVIYGLMVFYVKSDNVVQEQNNYYLAFTILFGFLYMVASQIGITLLLWAMCKSLKGTSRLMALYSAIGYSFLPYGVLAAIATNYNAISFSRFLLIAIALVCFLWWIFSLTRIIHFTEGFTLRKAFLAVALCLTFFGSFIYVFGY